MNEKPYRSVHEHATLSTATASAATSVLKYSPTDTEAMIAEIAQLRTEVARLQREVADVRATALANEATQLGRTLLTYVLDVICALLLPQRGQSIIIDLADQTIRHEAQEAQASIGPLQMALERPYLAGAVLGTSGRLTTRYEATLWLPIMHGADVAVILCLRRASSNPFSARDQQLGEVLGALVISAQQTGHRLTTDQDALRHLSSTLNARIRMAGGKVAAMGRDAERLAQGFRLAADECAAIRLAAMLHDIGTVDLAEDLLQKEGPLSADEIAQMREHPAFGAEIVRQLSGMDAVIPLVRHHHERWDGKGYPAGMTAGEIPMGARIIAVVDAFHAMISPRPYRTAHTIADALSELRRCSGSQFDPRVVDELTRLVREDEVH